MEPEKTPMYSLLPQSEAPKATVVEWINDDLPEVDFANPLADGTDITLSILPTNMLTVFMSEIVSSSSTRAQFRQSRNVGCSRRI